MGIHEKYRSKYYWYSKFSKVMLKHKIKLIYFSTGYVYPGTKGNYTEKDGVKPFNNYGLSKLGGECSVSMYKKFLSWHHND